MKRILFISHSSDAFGGAEDDLVRIMKHFMMKTQSYYIDVLTPEGEGVKTYAKYCKNVFNYKWGIFPFANPSLTGYLKYILKFFIQFSQILRNFRNINYDLCIVNVSVLLWPPLYFKLKKSKIIYFMRETILPKFSKIGYYKIISLVGDYFFGVSRSITDEFIKISGNNNAQTLYSAIEDQEIQLSDIISASHDISIEDLDKFYSSDTFKFLNIGKISPVKNQLLILKALNIIIKRDPVKDVMIYFIGGFGDNKRYARKINKYIHDNKLKKYVFFWGQLERDICYEVLKNVDSLIISSISEGMPLVLVEAFKFKIPLITTDVGGITEVLTNGESGMVIEVDPSSLADAMESMMSNTEMRIKISNNAYEVFKEKFDLRKNLKKIDNIVEKLIYKTEN